MQHREHLKGVEIVGAQIQDVKITAAQGYLTCKNNIFANLTYKNNIFAMKHCLKAI